MDTNEIRHQLDVIRNSCDVIEGNLYDILVKPGDNLASIIASAPVDSVIAIDNSYVTDGDLIISKPVTLRALTQPLAGRISPTARLPQINGSVTNAAPDIGLMAISIQGVNKDRTLFTGFDDSMILQCIIHGSPSGQHRGARVDAKNISVHDSYIAGIFADIDTQAIAAWDGCNGLDIDNCYLEASGENVLFGGADASSESRLPQNIVINNCDIVKPLSWMGNSSITAKNLFEIKAGKNIKLLNSRLTNSWRSGQTGYALVLTVRNQDGSAPFSIIQDVLIDSCIIQNAGAGIQILGRDDSNPSQIMNHVAINNSQFHLNSAIGAGMQLFISGGPDSLSLNNLEFEGDGLNSFMSFDQPQFLTTKFKFSACRFQEGDYGIFGTGAPALGKAVLDMYAPGYICNINAVTKGTSGRNIQYPDCIVVTP